MKLTEHFDSEEFTCKCGCGFNDINIMLVNTLEEVRATILEPVRISSGCRCAKYNMSVGGKPDSAHVKGDAVDILWPENLDKRKMFLHIITHLFDRIGLDNWFVHVDVNKVLPQPRVWFY